MKDVLLSFPAIVFGALIIVVLAVVVFIYVRQSKIPEPAEVSVKFHSNYKEGKIESNDPEVFVRILAARKEGPLQMFLNIGEDRFGFSIENGGKDPSTGLRIWQLVEICQRIEDLSQTRAQGGRLAYYTNRSSFSSLEEQEKVISLISSALSIFSGMMEDPEDTVVAMMVISRPLHRKIGDGEFLPRS